MPGRRMYPRFQADLLNVSLSQGSSPIWQDRSTYLWARNTKEALSMDDGGGSNNNTLQKKALARGMELALTG